MSAATVAAMPVWAENDRVIVTYANLQLRADGGFDELKTTYPARFVRYDGEGRLWAIVRNTLGHERKVPVQCLRNDDREGEIDAPLVPLPSIVSTADLVVALNTLRDRCHDNSRAHGFHDKDQPLPEAIALMHSKLSEALEDHRAGEAPNHVWYTAKGSDGVSMRIGAQDDGGHPTFRGALMKPCGIPSKFADVIIRVMDTCGLHRIDIGTAVAQKMAYNATRPYKHNKTY